MTTKRIRNANNANGAIEILDNGTIQISDNADRTKKLLFDLSGIPTGTTQVLEPGGGSGSSDIVTIAGVDPTLDLVFDTNVPGSISFSRDSIATYFDRDGYLKIASNNIPRINYNPVTMVSKGFLLEKSRTNLFTGTEQFGSNLWPATRAFIAQNVEVAPDGTRTAAKLIEDATTPANTHYTAQSATLVSGTAYSVSLFVKAAERTRIQIRMVQTASQQMLFDTSTVTTTVTAGSPTGTIVPVGNGWYLCTMVAISDTTGAVSIAVRLDNGGTVSYEGDGKSGMYIWGAQIEAGSVPTSYMPSLQTWQDRVGSGGTANATYYDASGILRTTSGAVARTTYNPNPDKMHLAPKLLLEEEKTNLCLQSENFSTTWTNIGSTETVNVVVAPSGSSTADKFIIDNGVSSGGAAILQSVAVPSASAVYTFSCFVKKGEYSCPRLLIRDVATSANSSHVYFNLLTGEVLNPSASGTYTYISSTIQQLPNGWYRCSLTLLIGADATISLRIYAYDGAAVTVTGNGTSGFYLWGAQLEAAYGPTSYIATTTATVKRYADNYTSVPLTREYDNASMTGESFSDWYRWDEGCVYLEGDNTNGETSRMVSIGVPNSAASDYIAFGMYSSSSSCPGIVSDSVTQAAVLYSYTLGTTAKLIGSWKKDSVQGAVNGTLLTEDTQAIIPTRVNRLDLGKSSANDRQIIGHIKRLTFFPSRLSNEKLEQMTR